MLRLEGQKEHSYAASRPARPSCHCKVTLQLAAPDRQVESSDLKLVPPIAGAFWTPKQPRPYDQSLPTYTVTYSEEEKAAQRQAYDEHVQGLKDALAAGQPGYTFPPGVYRSRERMYIEVSLCDLTPPTFSAPSQPLSVRHTALWVQWRAWAMHTVSEETRGGMPGWIARGTCMAPGRQPESG